MPRRKTHVHPARKSERMTISEIKELLMLTVARLDAAIAQFKATADENTSLKSQITALQAQVAAAPDPAVVGKASDLVDAILGPEPTPAPADAPAQG